MRAGKLNHETAFVLERFGVPVPAEIDNLVATVSELVLIRPITAGINGSVQALALVMREHGVRSVPVVEGTGRRAGVVGLKDIAGHYLESVGFSDRAKAPINLDILVKTLDSRVLSSPRRRCWCSTPSGRARSASWSRARPGSSRRPST